MHIICKYSLSHECDDRQWDTINNDCNCNEIYLRKLKLEKLNDKSRRQSILY